MKNKTAKVKRNTGNLVRLRDNNNNETEFATAGIINMGNKMIAENRTFTHAG